MKNINKYTIALGFALLLLIITLVMLLTGNGPKTGPLTNCIFHNIIFCSKRVSAYKGFVFYNVDVYSGICSYVLSAVFCFHGRISFEIADSPSSADNNVWDGFTNEP